MRSNPPDAPECDSSLEGFIGRLRKLHPGIVLDTAGVWEFYVDDYAEHSKPNDRPLTRHQLFRKLRLAGMHRFRSGAKDPAGVRRYLYRLTE